MIMILFTNTNDFFELCLKIDIVNLVANKSRHGDKLLTGVFGCFYGHEQ